MTFTIYIEVEINRNYLKITSIEKVPTDKNQTVVTRLFSDYYFVKQVLAKTKFISNVTLRKAN